MAGLWAALRDFFTPHGVEVLQNVHPLIVHFPIGLLFAAALLYLWAWIGRRDALQWTALWTLLLGTIAALFAVWSGWRAGEGVMVAPAVREHILEPHRRVMLSMFALSVVLCGWALWARPMPRRGRAAFIAGLVLMAALLAKGADLGGWMVYGYNAGGALPQPIDFSR
jgi:uncharacterized membrane protein